MSEDITDLESLEKGPERKKTKPPPTYTMSVAEGMREKMDKVAHENWFISTSEYVRSLIREDLIRRGIYREEKEG